MPNQKKKNQEPNSKNQKDPRITRMTPKRKDPAQTTDDTEYTDEKGTETANH
jgi:hypothetical protein